MSEKAIAFRDSLQKGDTGEAISRFDEFDEALDTLSSRESAVRNAARGIIARVPENRPVHQAAQGYLQAVAQAEQARIKAKNDFLLHLEGGPEGSEVAEQVTAVIEANQKVRDSEEKIRDNGSVPVPAIVEVYGPDTLKVPKGGSIDSTYTATNVGFKETTDLSVMVKGYDLSVTPSTIQSLSGGENTSIHVSGIAKTEINTVIKIKAGTDTEQTRLQVLDKVDYLNESLNLVDALDQSLDKIGDNKHGNNKSGDNKRGKSSGEKSGVKGLENKVDTIRKQINKTIQIIQDSKSDKINGKIRSLMNLVGAFINQVEALMPQHIEERTSTILKQDAEELINTLESATKADT